MPASFLIFADEIDFPLEEYEALSNGDGAMLRLAFLLVIMVSAFALIAVRVKSRKRVESRSVEGEVPTTETRDDERLER